MFKNYPENLIGLRVNKGVNIIDYWLNPKWNILDEHIKEGVEVKKQKVSEETGFNYYVMYSQNFSLEELYNMFVEIIEHNVDLEKKQELFTQKISELKDIFGKLDYEELASLSFETPLSVLPKPNTQTKLESEEEDPQLETESVIESESDEVVENEEVNEGNELEIENS